jgi:hypothetical protein
MIVHFKPNILQLNAGLFRRCLLFRAPFDYVTISAFILPGAVPLGGHPPGRTRMPATGRTAFTTAHRMVYRVHGNTADLGTAAFPSIPACFSKGNVFMGDVPQLAHSGLAVEQHHPNLTRRQFYQGVAVFLGHQLCKRSSTANNLTALTDPKFDIVNVGSQGDISQR